jgi:hypothetical protein
MKSVTFYQITIAIQLKRFLKIVASEKCFIIPPSEIFQFTFFKYDEAEHPLGLQALNLDVVTM